VPAGGTLVVPLMLLDDPAVRGFALTSQAALLGTKYLGALTNGVTRIVRE
jgi:hypothetical protein